MFTRVLRNPLFALSALYALAYAPLLTMRGVYWDSWVWYTQFIYHDYAWIYSYSFDTTRVLHYYALFRFVDLFSDPILAERAIVFVSWLFSGLLLFYMLRGIFGWSVQNAFILSAYYLVFPVFIVRFDLMIGYNSFANLCFFAGTSLLLTALLQSKQKGALLEIASGPLFLLAFLVNSYPFYFAVVLAAHVWLFARKKELPVALTFAALKTTLTAWTKRYWYLIALPILFMLWRIFLYAPYGKDVHYNQLLIFDPSVGVFFQMAENLWGGLYAGLLWPMVSALSLVERKFFVLGVLLAGVAIWYLCREYVLRTPGSEQHSFVAKFPLIFGGVIAIIVLTPYLLVGKAPHIYGYGFGLRHGLLLGLPAALMIVGAIGYFVRERMQGAVHIALLSISVGFLWYNFFLLDMDWYKQQSVLQDLPSVIQEIPRGSLIVFTDNATGYNWQHRNIGLQEYNGWLDVLAGQRIYFGIGRIDFNQNHPYLQEFSATSSVQVVIRSERPLAEPVVREWVHLKWFELTHPPPLLRAEARRVLQVTVEKQNTALRP